MHPDPDLQTASLPERPAWLLLLLWLLAGLPLLFLGYGSDYDAWRVAQTASRLWQQGIYTPSRSLGFPLYEFLVTPLSALGGWPAANALALAAGGAIFMALRDLARRRHFRHPLLLIAGFLFLPVVCKNATVTMDYLPALACLLWSYALLMRSRPLAAALLAGLAAGFRPTAILFLIPLLVYLFRTADWKTCWRAALFGGLAALAAYSPILLAQGFVSPAPAPRSSWLQHLGLVAFHGLRFLGVAQSLFLLPLLWSGYKKTPAGSLPAHAAAFHLVNLVVWLGLFLLLPDEPEYLLPTLISLLYFMDRLLSRRAFAAALLLLLSYHFVQLELRPDQPDTLHIRPRLTAGYTIEDIRDRLFKIDSRRLATRFTPPQPTLLMFGLPWIPAANDHWVADAEPGLFRQQSGSFYLSGQITDRGQIERLRQRGIRLVAWRLAQWDYLRTGSTAWGDAVEVIDDLHELFGQSLRGKPLNQR